MNKRFAILLTLFQLCSCTVKPPAPLPSLTPSFNDTSPVTATNSPIPVITLSATIPAVNLLQIDSLSSGEYLVYLDNPASSSPDSIFLSLARPDGGFVGVLTQVGTTIVSISPDLKLVTELPEILDLSTGITTTYEELRGCWEPPSWAPDNQRFVVSCIRNDEVNLYVFSLEDRSLLQITDFSEKFSGRMPSWSPDGKWIAYLKRQNMSGSSEQTGLHLINVECFSSPVFCTNDEAGIGVRDPYTWSPDSQYLAGLGIDNTTGNNSINIYSVSNGKITIDRKYPVSIHVDWISWAPSSEIIALHTGENILLLSIETGEFQEIRQLPFLFWIRVP